MSTKSKTLIHWFRDDLRIDDHKVLNITGYDHFFGVYVIDKKHIKYTEFGFRKMGLQRLYHLRESLIELQVALREKGSDLLVLFGDTAELLKRLTQEYGADLSFQKGYGTEEIELQNAVEHNLNANVHLHKMEDGFLVPVEYSEAFTRNKFPNSFSGFRNKVEKKLKKEIENSKVIKGQVAPSPELFKTIKKVSYQKHPNSAFPFSGGTFSGKKRLNYYLYESKKASTYKDTRNGLIGEGYSTKFSPYLANGALSPRTILAELKNYEAQFGQNKSTYWIWFELLWRDYFRHALRHHGQKMFLKGGLNGNKIVLNDTNSAFKKWTEGKTPSSFVNANMIELRQTGFMSNRGRQNVASFLVYDLQSDWRKGAAWFEHCLIDYDVASNQGNWLYITGLGFNPKGGSRFNVSSQQERYDHDRSFTNLWTNN